MKLINSIVITLVLLSGLVFAKDITDFDIVTTNPNDRFYLVYKRTYDADTIVFEAPVMPKKLRTMSIRIAGIDTPEKRSKCAAEKELSQIATEFIREQIERPGVEIQVHIYHWDKFGGRFDGRVIVDGVDIHAALVGLGYARDYKKAVNKALLPPWKGCKLNSKGLSIDE